MLKKDYLRLGLVLGGLLSSVIALADNPSQSHKRLANNNTNPYGICKNGDVDVFSCELNSGDKLSLCANDNPKKIELGLKHHSGSVQNILMSEPKQIIAITRSGGTSIIRGNEKTGPVSVYIYIGNGEDEYAYSALVLPKGEVKFCKDNTSTINLNQTTNNNTNLNIWNLNDEKITTEFDLSGSQKETRKKTHDLWLSWPERK